MTEIYNNQIADRLGLNIDDQKIEGKLKRLCDDLASKILTPVSVEIDWHYCEVPGLKVRMIQ